MILKMDAFFRDPAQLGERENLETAAVGQDRAGPIHETMQPPKVTNDFRPWPNEKVVGVAENYLGFKLAQLAWTNAFHTSLSTYRHESGCLDPAVCSC